MITSLVKDNPSYSINELIRAVWKIDIDINASSIIRQYFEVKNRRKSKIVDESLPKIIYPSRFPHSKRIVVNDMVKYGVALTFQNFRKYGVSAEEIYELEKVNGWNRSD